MAFLADYVLDGALAKVAEGDRLYLCSQEPVTYTEATTTYALANKTGLSIGAASDATPNGRKVTIAGFTDGTVTAGGVTTATHYAIVDSVNSRLLESNALAASKQLVNGNPFTIQAFDIRFADAVSM